MSNMSYCRFQNTLSDLRDCESALETLHIHSEDIAATKEEIRLLEEELRTTTIEDYKEDLGEEIDELKESIEEVALSEEERVAAKVLVELCSQIHYSYSDFDFDKQQ